MIIKSPLFFLFLSRNSDGFWDSPDLRIQNSEQVLAWIRNNGPKQITLKSWTPWKTFLTFGLLKSIAKAKTDASKRTIRIAGYTLDQIRSPKSKYDLHSFTATIVHEYSHMLGYSHRFFDHQGRLETVPYKIGTIAEDISKTLKP